MFSRRVDTVKVTKHGNKLVFIRTAPDPQVMYVLGIHFPRYILQQGCDLFALWLQNNVWAFCYGSGQKQYFCSRFHNVYIRHSLCTGSDRPKLCVWKWLYNVRRIRNSYLYANSRPNCESCDIVCSYGETFPLPLAQEASQIDIMQHKSLINIR